jgi:hypothetical protein
VEVPIMDGNSHRPELHLERWAAALEQVCALADAGACTRFAELMDAVKGTESPRCAEFILGAVRLAHDNGVYESAYNALWRFPHEEIGTWLAGVLPAFQRRMGRTGQVERFLIPLSLSGPAQEGFVRASAGWLPVERRTIIAAMREWCRTTPEWEPLLMKVGGSPPAAPAPHDIPVEWPAKYRTFLARVRGGRTKLVEAWNGRSLRGQLDLVVALLTVEHGKTWRDVDALTNPLFTSFAKRLYPEFVEKVRMLPEKARATLLASLGRVAPAKLERLETDLRSQHDGVRMP